MAISLSVWRHPCVLVLLCYFFTFWNLCWALAVLWLCPDCPTKHLRWPIRQEFYTTFDSQNLWLKNRDQICQCQTIPKVFIRSIDTGSRTLFIPRAVRVPVQYCWSGCCIYEFSILSLRKKNFKYTIFHELHLAYCWRQKFASCNKKRWCNKWLTCKNYLAYYDRFPGKWVTCTQFRYRKDFQ